MNIWENAVITNKGVELEAKKLAGGTIRITSIKTGAGTVPVSQLPEQLAVSNIKQSCTLQDIRMDGNTAIIPVYLTNNGLTEAYQLRQVGFYTTDSDGNEILYAITQNTEPRYIPSEAEMPGYSLYWTFHFTMDNNVNLTVNVDPASYITTKTLKNAIASEIIDISDQFVMNPDDSILEMTNKSTYNNLTGHVDINLRIKGRFRYSAAEYLYLLMIWKDYAPDMAVPLVISHVSDGLLIYHPSAVFYGTLFPNEAEQFAEVKVACTEVLDDVEVELFVKASYYIEPGRYVKPNIY